MDVIYTLLFCVVGFVWCCIGKNSPGRYLPATNGKVDTMAMEEKAKEKEFLGLSFSLWQTEFPKILNSPEE